MRLPDLENKAYRELESESIIPYIEGDELSFKENQRKGVLQTPCYVIEHNNYITLTNSIDALMGLFIEGDKLDKDEVAVYITEKMGSAELVNLGKNNIDYLRDLLPAVVFRMYDNCMNVYYSDDGKCFKEIKTREVGSIRLKL